MDTLRRDEERFLGSVIRALFIVSMILLAACVLIQLGIHKGRTLEKTEAASKKGEVSNPVLYQWE